MNFNAQENHRILTNIIHFSSICIKPGSLRYDFRRENILAHQIWYKFEYIRTSELSSDVNTKHIFASDLDEPRLLQGEAPETILDWK